MIDCEKTINKALSHFDNRDAYAKYLKTYETFHDYLQLMPGKRQKVSDAAFTLFDDYIRMIDSTVDINIKKPKYMRWDELCEHIDQELHEALNKYQFEKKRYLYGNSTPDDYNKLVKLTDTINKLQGCKRNALELRNRYHEGYYLTIEKLSKEIQDYDNAMEAMEEEWNTTTDDLEKQRIMRKLIDMRTEGAGQRRKNILQLRTTRYLPLYPLDIVVRAPVVDKFSQNGDRRSRPISDVKKKKVQRKSSSNVGDTVTTIDKKITAKLKKAAKKTKAADAITTTDQEKQQLKRFLFKNLKECQSSKRTGQGFMTKEDMLEVIKQNPTLQSKLPKEYKKSKKGELCDTLLDVKEISE